MASDLLVATRSADKLREIVDIVGSFTSTRLVTLRDLGIDPTPQEDAIESHATFVGNAIAKAIYFAQLTGMRTLADDSGLVVAALGGAPGVRTRRFAIDHGYVAAHVIGKELDEANNRLLLQKLSAVADEQRAAHYVCAAAFATPDQPQITSIGTCAGMIARASKGSGGFGYDPLFFVPELSITFAELNAEQKNERSHRALAFRALTPHLK